MLICASKNFDCSFKINNLREKEEGGPVMDWWPVQGVPRFSPDDRWDRLQPPRDPTDGLSGYRKWMDGWKKRGKKSC